MKMDCAICMNEFDNDMFSTYCGHIYCEKCINEMLKKSSCWTCSKTLSQSEVHRLYIPQSANSSKNVGDVTANEMLQIKVSELEIENEKLEKELSTFRDLNDMYALMCAKLQSNQDELKRKIEESEKNINEYQEKLANCQELLDQLGTKDSIKLNALIAKKITN